MLCAVRKIRDYLSQDDHLSCWHENMLLWLFRPLNVTINVTCSVRLQLPDAWPALQWTLDLLFCSLLLYTLTLKIINVNLPKRAAFHVCIYSERIYPRVQIMDGVQSAAVYEMILMRVHHVRYLRLVAGGQVPHCRSITRRRAAHHHHLPHIDKEIAVMAAIIAQMTRARRERLKRVEVRKHFVALGVVQQWQLVKRGKWFNPGRMSHGEFKI